MPRDNNQIGHDPADIKCRPALGPRRCPEKNQGQSVARQAE